ncbi:MAG: VOC family protein, partial [Patescibacteria group bacterium]
RLMKIDEYSAFLDSWLLEIEKIGINVTDFPLDHLGYSAGSSEEYDKIKLEFLIAGKLFREAMVSGRRVGIFELFKPLKYKDYLISAVELIEPKAGELRRSGYEHAEFTINSPFEDLVKKYPGLSWDTNNINRPDFPRLKIVLGNGTELKFNRSPILSL